MRLQMYHVNVSYCQYLRKFDACVPYVSEDKKTRPFIGIIITVHDHSFYAPLSSPKQKHLNMRDQLDFIKIEEGILGAINLNNMIPIHQSQISMIDIRLNLNDDKDTTAYKNLLNNQLDWCNKNYHYIQDKATLLYSLISSDKADVKLKNRCCKFQKDLLLLNEYEERYNKV